MSQKRKHGVALNIPFIDDSSGVMANGVPLGRPKTPPVIQITIPETEVKHKSEKKVATVLDSKPESTSDNQKKNMNEMDYPDPRHATTSQSVEEEEEEEKALKNTLDVPLTKRHRRNSISLPAGLDSLDVQVIKEKAHGRQTWAADCDNFPKC